MQGGEPETESSCRGDNQPKTEDVAYLSSDKGLEARKNDHLVWARVANRTILINSLLMVGSELLHLLIIDRAAGEIAEIALHIHILVDQLFQDSFTRSGVGSTSEVSTNCTMIISSSVRLQSVGINTRRD
jgi:hypothetical protein